MTLGLTPAQWGSILKTHPDRKIILKVLNELVNGKVLLSTRHTLARELKLPLYSIDRILYLLVALQLVAIEVAGRTHIAYPTIFAEKLVGHDPQ